MRVKFTLKTITNCIQKNNCFAIRYQELVIYRAIDGEYGSQSNYSICISLLVRVYQRFLNDTKAMEFENNRFLHFKWNQF